MKGYAVITGASSGIGAEFAKRLSKKGYPLILTARREELLEKLSKDIDGECRIIKADLSKEEECFRFFEEIKDDKIDIFINNAGFGDYGRFTNTDLNKELNMINVNIKAIHILTKLILDKFNKKNKGYILNVASSAGLMPAGPYMASYYASKSYVVSLTKAIAEEFRAEKSKVYIGCLCPGPVNTEFNDVANVKFALKGITAGYCVKYTLKQMAKGKTIIVPTIKMQLATSLIRFVPEHIAVKIVSLQQKKKA